MTGSGGSSTRARRLVPGRQLLIAGLAFCTIAAVAACAPPNPSGGGGTPRSITITASSGTIAYGDAVPAVTPSYAGLASGHTATTTPPTCSTTATSTSPPGDYETVCAGAANGSDTITYTSGTLHITPAPVVVTASSSSMDVGGAVPTITASYAGLKNGDVEPAVLPLCETTATSTSQVGTYASSCSGAADPNYTFTYVDGSVGVGTVQVTVTASSAASTFGSAAPTITPSYSGFVNGDTAPATAPTCGTAATSSSPVGTYASSCSGAADPNYTFTYVDGSVSVGPAAAVVTASSATVPFNATVPAITASYSGLVNGDTAPATAPTCSTTATASSPVDTYPSSCSGAADPNYTFTYVDGVVTITAGAIPVTVTASSATITYGDAVPAVTPSYVGFLGGQTSPTTDATCSTTATSSSPAGTYPTTCSGADDPNHTFDYVEGAITIQPKDATVTASSDSFTYGGTVPTITATYSGLVNGDTAPATAPTCGTVATSSSPVGTYPSSCSGAADPNYSFSSVDGTVAVGKAGATVTASSDSFTYGATVPTITATYSGLVNGDTAPATAPTCGTVATSSSPVDSYASTCSGADDPNYTLGYVAGSVGVTPKDATITASSSTTSYGSTPTVTASYSGLVNGDTAASTAPTCSTTATSSSAPGTYPSSCSGADDQNYSFSYVAGTVTVVPAPVVVTASSATISVGDAVPAVTASYSGLQNGDTAPATPATCSTTADGSTAGTFPSTCSGASDPNYTFSYVAGSVTVNPVVANVTVTASSPDVELGTAPVVTPTYSGLTGGDTAPATPPTCTTTATASSPIGRYTTSCSGASDPKYTFTYVGGTAKVHPSDGYGEYDPTSFSTTLSSATLNLTSATSMSVTANPGFTNYSNLTIQSAANGPQAYFCKTVVSTTSWSGCTSNGAAGTASAGAYITAAPMSRFDVFTVGGGSANLASTSLTILNDVPAAQRGIPSTTTATSTNGIITYVQSATPTGSFDLTYGICRAGTAAYSAADPTCSTGVIHYNPGVTSQIGQDVTVIGVTNHTYQAIDSSVIAPASVNPNETFKVRIAPAPGAIPKLQPSSAGDASVNNSSRFTSVYPVPAGFTVQSFRLIGGDAFSAAPTNGATATLCTTYGAGAGGCAARAATGNYVNNTSPYIIVQMPSAVNVAGGRQMTMPTLEVTLKATGASSTVGKYILSEILNVTVATLIIQTTATFEGYPTNPANTGVTPPLATPVTLATTTIN